MAGKRHNDQSSESNTLQVALHRRIAEKLTNQITNGELKPGQKLPSERRIAHQFKGSRATVRTALQHLEQAGLITRRDRRSAVVSIHRNLTPSFRIACSNGRLVHLFRQLNQKQLLPPRCQLQLLDLQQSGVISNFLAQPAISADILICEQEYVNGFRDAKDIFVHLPKNVINEAEIHKTISLAFSQDGQHLAIPLSISPMVLYYNQALIREFNMDTPSESWDWNQLDQIAQKCLSGGRYGFQFRPCFEHLACIAARRGDQLYQSNGKIAAHSPSFESTLRFIHHLLYESKVSPILAKVDQFDLFAQHRCAMAMDGFDLYPKVDKQAIVDNVRKIGNLVATNFIPPDSLAGYHCDRGPDYNPRKAQELLAAAGYPNGKGLPPIEILYNTSGGHEKIAESVAEMWRKILNVTVYLKGKEIKSFDEDKKHHRFMVCRSSWYGDYSDPTTFLDILSTGNGQNDAAFSCEAYDRLLQQAALCRNPDQRLQLLAQAETLLIQEEIPVLPLFHYVNLMAYKPYVKGLYSNPRDIQPFKYISVVK